jgi:hypothetical protein
VSLFLPLCVRTASSPLCWHVVAQQIHPLHFVAECASACWTSELSAGGVSFSARRHAARSSVRAGWASPEGTHARVAC